ncbi:hypothetical protein VTN96DRAFT_7315 [Rasamsonia emersonii]|uniref:Centromere protein X n=1 Tax=Rasamsonia emersonii (strain ATCC 16479 / CBS 393.64 / IMI 116815) TaxID=1408163 RepID=A0A0F4Z2W0_RASE3|nr:hypothetical protein T310_1282 [Rasamsonia emersonii CBS 393.64]KKA24675.1 hypothetical protein T310_1282 [Rasamsonia emersonii CBS 393.64]
MPADRQNTVQKRRRLPFKPPSRRESTTAEASASAPKTTKSSATSRKSTATATASAPASKKPRKSTSSRQKARSPSVSVSGTDEEEPGSLSGSESGSDSVSASSSNRERSPSEEPDYILAEIITNDRARDIESGEPAIPQKLLTKLLHHHFQSEKTKITKDANAVVAKYVDIFVREALARAAYERTGGDGNADAGGGRGSVGDGFLEVEDLEKLAPQMILDF